MKPSQINTNQKRINQKGFIGPIGDDLPSLIPLTVALLIFFGAFGFAFNHFEEKKLEFDQRLLLLSIGKTLKGDSLIDHYKKWELGCNSIEVSRYRFRAVVFLISTKTDAKFYNYEFFSDWQAGPQNNEPFSATNNTRIFLMQTPTGNPKPLVCENTGVAESVDDLEALSSAKGLSQNGLRVNFPVAVADSDAFKPAILSVMVWRN